MNLFKKFKTARMHVQNLTYSLKVNEFTALTTNELVSRYKRQQAQQCMECPEALENS